MAILNGFYDEAKEILLSDNIGELNNLARIIEPNFSQDSEKFMLGIMWTTLQRKFEQNPDANEMLQKSKPYHIIYESTSNVWGYFFNFKYKWINNWISGAKYSVNPINEDFDVFLGEDWLGYILDFLRIEFEGKISLTRRIQSLTLGDSIMGTLSKQSFLLQHNIELIPRKFQSFCHSKGFIILLFIILY